MRRPHGSDRSIASIYLCLYLYLYKYIIKVHVWFHQSRGLFSSYIYLYIFISLAGSMRRPHGWGRWTAPARASPRLDIYKDMHIYIHIYTYSPLQLEIRVVHMAGVVGQPLCERLDDALRNLVSVVDLLDGHLEGLDVTTDSHQSVPAKDRVVIYVYIYM